MVCNLKDGIDIYALSPFRLLKSFKHRIRVNVILQVTMVMKGRWIISGSDDGVVRFFDPNSGQLIHCLHHSDRKS